MPNMSYCRFRNTLADLRDAYDALPGGDSETREPLSDDERRAAAQLVKLCRRIAHDYTDDETGAVTDAALLDPPSLPRLPPAGSC